MAELVAEIEHRGYLQRTTDPADRRAKIASSPPPDSPSRGLLLRGWDHLDCQSMDPAAARGGGRAGRLSVSCAVASLPLYAYNASHLAGKVYYLFEDDLVVGILYPQTGPSWSAARHATRSAGCSSSPRCSA
jgi:hypothetical protein